MAVWRRRCPLWWRWRSVLGAAGAGARMIAAGMGGGGTGALSSKNNEGI